MIAIPIITGLFFIYMGVSGYIPFFVCLFAWAAVSASIAILVRSIIE